MNTCHSHRMNHFPELCGFSELLLQLGAARNTNKKADFRGACQRTLPVVNFPVNFLAFRGTDQQKSLLYFLLCWFDFGHSEEKALKYNKNCQQLWRSKGSITHSWQSLQRFGFFLFLPHCRFGVSQQHMFWPENC